MLGDGMASFMSIAMGKKENDKINKAVAVGFLAATISALFLSLKLKKIKVAEEEGKAELGPNK